MRAAGMTAADTANNTAPLYVDFIKIEENQVIIDGVRTTWVALGRLPNGETFHFLGIQQGQGAPYDVDQHGRREVDLHLEQGDIAIEDSMLAVEQVLPIPQNPVKDVEFNLKRTTENLRTEKVEVAVSNPGLKIRDALRLNIERVVGTFDRPVFVERFSFRLPVGLKLNIMDLCLQSNGNNVINGLLPIINQPIKYMLLQVRHYYTLTAVL